MPYLRLSIDAQTNLENTQVKQALTKCIEQTATDLKANPDKCVGIIEHHQQIVGGEQSNKPLLKLNIELLKGRSPELLNTYAANLTNVLNECLNSQQRYKIAVLVFEIDAYASK